MRRKKKSEFDFIDLFAGIGGFHIPMHKNGGQCVFASEIDKFARQTYLHNFKKTSPEIFETGNFNEDITDPSLDYKNIPNFDVLCAGFPCQAFSHAGLKKGFDDTRGTLFFNIKEIVKTKIEQNKQDKAIKIPKVLLLENVKGLKNHDKGKTFKIIKSSLEELGYKVQAEVLNSKHFGVPQNRERIFIVAWYKDLIDIPHFNFPYGLSEKNKPFFEKDNRDLLAKNTRLGDILLEDQELVLLEEEKEKSYTISDRLWTGHQRRKEQHKLKGNGFGYSLFEADSKYTSTISARYYKDGSEILINQDSIVARPNRPRKLHPLEAARLQGYPVDDWYEIPVSDNQAYKQFGNSVSVPVVTTIASEIKKQLLC